MSMAKPRHEAHSNFLLRIEASTRAPLRLFLHPGPFLAPPRVDLRVLLGKTGNELPSPEGRNTLRDHERMRSCHAMNYPSLLGRDRKHQRARSFGSAVECDVR